LPTVGASSSLAVEKHGKRPASYPNGRVPTNDVYSYRFAWLTHGKVPPQGLKPHDDLQAEFSYLGLPHPQPAGTSPSTYALSEITQTKEN
jgi:hypothetical protein